MNPGRAAWQDAAVSTDGQVRAVNAMFAVITTKSGVESGIDKRPMPTPVVVGSLGLAGDRQLDTAHHGGPDKAVYAYAAEDLDWWAEQLDRELTPGLFGENLTLAGIDVTGAVVGERWTVGTDGLVLEVTMPRTPCRTFADRMDEPRWVRRFTEGGRPGAYLRVVQPGTVAAGDAVVVSARPSHGVSIADIFPAPQPATIARLVQAEDDGEITLAASVRRRAAKVAARA